MTTTPPLGFGLPHLRRRGPTGLLVFQWDRPLMYPQSPAPGLCPQPVVCDPRTAAACTAPQLLLWPPRSISGSFHSSKPAASASTPGRREWTPSSGTRHLACPTPTLQAVLEGQCSHPAQDSPGGPACGSA